MPLAQKGCQGEGARWAGRRGAHRKLIMGPEKEKQVTEGGISTSMCVWSEPGLRNAKLITPHVIRDGRASVQVWPALAPWPPGPTLPIIVLVEALTLLLPLTTKLARAFKFEFNHWL